MRHSRLHRITAALTSALLLQLSLLGSGTVCPMHAGGMAAGAAHGDVRAHGAHHAAPGAPHSTRAMATVASVAPASPTGASQGACDSGRSCGMPWAPGACTVSGGCAIGTTARMTAMPTVPASTHATIEAVRAAALPLGPSYTPELPPPRA